MVLITIVNGVYKPTYNWGAPHCIHFPDPHDTSMDSSRCDSGAVDVDVAADFFPAAVGTGAVGVAPRRWWTKVTLELPMCLG
jgi:hypothetical protein